METNADAPVGRVDRRKSPSLSVRRACVRRALLAAAGLLCLAAGTLEYLTGRGGAAFFLEPFPALREAFRGLPSPFGAWGAVAPDFLHALGFALIAVACAPGGRRARLVVCGAWLAIEAGLEAGQAGGAHLAARLPGWIAGLPLLGRLGDYLTRGVFDPADLAAIVLGCAAAFTAGELALGEAFRLRRRTS